MAGATPQRWQHVYAVDNVSRGSAGGVVFLSWLLVLRRVGATTQTTKSMACSQCRSTMWECLPLETGKAWPRRAGTMCRVTLPLKVGLRVSSEQAS